MTMGSAPPTSASNSNGNENAAENGDNNNIEGSKTYDATMTEATGNTSQPAAPAAERQTPRPPPAPPDITQQSTIRATSAAAIEDGGESSSAVTPVANAPLSDTTTITRITNDAKDATSGPTNTRQHEPNDITASTGSTQGVYRRSGITVQGMYEPISKTRIKAETKDITSSAVYNTIDHGSGLSSSVQVTTNTGSRPPTSAYTPSISASDSIQPPPAKKPKITQKRPPQSTSQTATNSSYHSTISPIPASRSAPQYTNIASGTAGLRPGDSRASLTAPIPSPAVSRTGIPASVAALSRIDPNATTFSMAVAPPVSTRANTEAPLPPLHVARVAESPDVTRTYASTASNNKALAPSGVTAAPITTVPSLSVHTRAAQSAPTTLPVQTAMSSAANSKAVAPAAPVATTSKVSAHVATVSKANAPVAAVSSFPKVVAPSAASSSAFIAPAGSVVVAPGEPVSSVSAIMPSATVAASDTRGVPVTSHATAVSTHAVAVSKVAMPSAASPKASMPASAPKAALPPSSATAVPRVARPSATSPPSSISTASNATTHSAVLPTVPVPTSAIDPKVAAPTAPVAGSHKAAKPKGSVPPAALTSAPKAHAAPSLASSSSPNNNSVVSLPPAPPTSTTASSMDVSRPSISTQPPNAALVTTSSSQMPQAKKKSAGDAKASHPTKHVPSKSTNVQVSNIPTPNTENPSTSINYTTNTTTVDPLSPFVPDHPLLQKTVKELVALLQIYGPLTLRQLEHNLPPIFPQGQTKSTSPSNTLASKSVSNIGAPGNATHHPPTSVSASTSLPTVASNEQHIQTSQNPSPPASSSHQPASISSKPTSPVRQPQQSAPHWKILDILEVLLCTGLVQKVKEDNNDNPSSSTEIRYCINAGMPRVVALHPCDIMTEMKKAHDEATASWKRSQILEEALKKADPKQSAKSILEGMLKEYPDISYDPVFVAAMRNCNVDMTPVTGTNTSFPTSGSNSPRSKASSSKKAKNKKKKPTAKSKSPATATAKAQSREGTGRKATPKPSAAAPSKTPVPAAKTVASAANAPVTSTKAAATTTAVKVAIPETTVKTTTSSASVKAAVPAVSVKKTASVPSQLAAPMNTNKISNKATVTANTTLKAPAPALTSKRAAPENSAAMTTASNNTAANAAAAFAPTTNNISAAPGAPGGATNVAAMPVATTTPLPISSSATTPINSSSTFASTTVKPATVKKASATATKEAIPNIKTPAGTPAPIFGNALTWPSAGETTAMGVPNSLPASVSQSIGSPALQTPLPQLHTVQARPAPNPTNMQYLPTATKSNTVSDKISLKADTADTPMGQEMAAPSKPSAVKKLPDNTSSN